MKAWFGASTQKIHKYHKYYTAIREYLLQKDVVLVDDWLPRVDISKKSGSRNIKKLYQDTINAIIKSDVSIIEFSVPSFSTSHEIHVALLRKKPTLVLQLDEKATYFNDSYLNALESKQLVVRKYTRDTMADIIDEFLGLSRIEKGQGRYNVVLDKAQKYYLDWASEKYNRTRSSLLREAIDGFIDTDENYNKYLRS